MRALVFREYAGALAVETVRDPVPPPGGVVVAVEATGVCRSDWHGWQGHDPDITLPHVPGHELAGTVAALGTGVRRWRVGDRVTVPFVCACGVCTFCLTGDGQVCPDQTQPGFTHWGSMAGLVALHAADVNLVALPESLPSEVAAALGCRFATAYRAVAQVGRVAPGEWMAVHGCGGLGLSAVQVAVALGARVIGVDVSPGALALAGEFGAEVVVDAREQDPVAAVLGHSGGGVHLSLDALGSLPTCVNSVLSLRRRGRHVQVGLLPPELGRPLVPLDRVLGWELEILGSHGLAAGGYPELLELVTSGRVRPERLLSRVVGLDAAGAALAEVGRQPGITVVTP